MPRRISQARWRARRPGPAAGQPSARAQPRSASCDGHARLHGVCIIYYCFQELSMHVLQLARCYNYNSHGRHHVALVSGTHSVHMHTNNKITIMPCA